MTRVALGETIAGYRLEAVAGRGGMGVVYRATQLRLGRTVAFKVIVPDLAGDADYRRRFQREARLAASIEHPNVIPVYEADELDSGELYLAMRWVEGTDLRELLAREGVLTAPSAARLLAPVALALGAAHARGLVHRDVKPANILIAHGGDPEREHVYLTDFGIARAPGEEPGLTRTGAFLGSLAYAAPERIEGERGGPAADVYALGCVLFETLTGHAPFNRESELATMRAHVGDPVPSVCAQAAGVPPELDEVARIALAKAPGQRFADATEMALAIEAAVTGTTVTRPAPVASRTEANVVDRTSEETVVPRAAPRRSRRAAVIVFGALAAGAIVVLALIVSNSGGRRSPRTTPSLPKSASPLRESSAKVAAVPQELSFNPGAVAILRGDDLAAAVTDPRGGRIWLIHPSGRPPTPIGVGRLPSALAVDAGRVWVADAGSNDVRVIDPSTTRTLARVPVGAAPSAIAIGGGLAWVADRRSNDVTAIDLATLRRAGSPIPTRGQGPVAIAYGSGATVWVANRGSSDVTAMRPSRSDASSYVPAPPIYVSGGPISVAGGVQADAWVGTADGAVVHLAKSAQPVGSRLALHSAAAALTVVGDEVWILARDDATLVRVRATDTPRILQRVSLSPAQLPQALACERSECLVSSGPTRQLVMAGF
jgi:YVTN family beta-propeller protein